MLTFQEYMLPILRVMTEGKDMSRYDIIAKVAEYTKISEEDKRLKYESSGITIYMDRIGWALSYLKKAQLIKQPARMMYSITELGLKLANDQSLKEISLDYLAKKGIYKYVKGPKKVSEKTEKDDDKDDAYATSTDLLFKNFENIRKNVCDQLLEKVLEKDCYFFEELVVRLLTAMGYGAGTEDSAIVTVKSGDGGIDGIIAQDALGLDKIYVQAKRYTDKPVGRPEVQGFVGAMDDKSLAKGVFITTSTFTKEAENYHSNHCSLVLIDGDKLVSLMYKYGIGVTKVDELAIKEIDEDFFE